MQSFQKMVWFKPNCTSSSMIIAFESTDHSKQHWHGRHSDQCLKSTMPASSDGLYLWPYLSLRWRHDGHVCISNHQPHDCLLNRLFRRRSKKTSKLRATGLCAGNSSGTGEFPAQMAINAENVSIWWRHHDWHKVIDSAFMELHYSKWWPNYTHPGYTRVGCLP